MKTLNKKIDLSYVLLIVVLLLFSGFFLYLETLTHNEFLYHLAAIPLEIIVGALIVERYLTRVQKRTRARQFMFIKSCLFRSELRNLYLTNFGALAKPEVDMGKIKNASLNELKKMREEAETVEYSSPEAMESVIIEYVNAYNVFFGFMEWAINSEYENLFNDMVHLLHFIHDVQIYKRQNPEGLFIHEAQRHPELMNMVHQVLTEGIKKFLDYALELKEKQPIVFDELMADYVISSRLEVPFRKDRRNSNLPV
jgi:hypothetical protein